jgi:hypothetical protein
MKDKICYFISQDYFNDLEDYKMIFLKVIYHTVSM